MNINILLTIHIMDLTFFFCVLNVLLAGNLSQCSYLGPSFYFMTNSGNFLSFFSLQISTFHKIKTRH